MGRLRQLEDRRLTLHLKRRIMNDISEEDL